MSGARPGWWLGEPGTAPGKTCTPVRDASRGGLRVSDGRSGYRVFIGRSARREMLKPLGGVDGNEVGGALFGRIDGDWIDVMDACVAVYDATARSAMLDLDFVDRQAQRHAGITGWRCVGCWHSHPSRTSGVMPSVSDLETWRSWCRHYGEKPFVGLVIAAPDQ